MEKNFNIQDYVKILGEELVFEFIKAGMTTHPHAVGSGRENSARKKLKDILPAGIGIGSGFVIDSYGHTSHQCDIILYEENFAMKFTMNGDEANTYYNCESVIAVGEVKSVAGTTEVRDAINKLKKIKQLKRYNDDGYNYRKYLSSTAIRNTIGDEKLEYNIDNDPRGQIFTFLLCQELKIKTENLIKMLQENCDKEYEYINRVLSVQGAYISFLDTTSNPLKIMLGKTGADTVFNMVDNPYVFNHFVHNLVDYITCATTVPLNYGRYLAIPINLKDLKEIVKLNQ